MPQNGKKRIYRKKKCKKGEVDLIFFLVTKLSIHILLRSLLISYQCGPSFVKLYPTRYLATRTNKKYLKVCPIEALYS